MTVQQIRDAIDTQAVAVLTALATRQAIYYAAHGRYWQGLRSHMVLPANGNPSAPDNASGHPYYETDTWSTLNILPASPLFALTVDQYQGPNGDGYMVTLFVTIAGVTHTRVLQHGAEAWRDRAWSAAA